MKLKTRIFAASGALAVSATSAFGAAHMASEMTLVSWGGAYQASQQAAYVEPYLAMNDGVTAV